MTAAAQHTAGPWTLFHHESSGARYIDAGSVQMQITRTSDAGASQIDANARLIAAAPDLLEALIDCRRALEIANFTQELAVVDAALAKAQEGGAS